MDLLWKERKRIWCGLPLTFTVYSYDNERFYVKSGFLNQRQDEVRLYRIQDLTVTRSLSQRIFGMGTILVNSSDKTLGDFEIKNIKNVMGFGDMGLFYKVERVGKVMKIIVVSARTDEQVYNEAAKRRDRYDL